MDQTLLTHLSEITEEEQAILSGSTQIQQELYTTDDSAVFDSHRLLAQNKLITFRTHTRFIHFPKHRHNYVEMIYMCSEVRLIFSMTVNASFCGRGKSCY